MSVIAVQSPALFPHKAQPHTNVDGCHVIDKDSTLEALTIAKNVLQEGSLACSQEA